MKKILVSISQDMDVDVICDFTSVHSVKDAKICISRMLSSLPEHLQAEAVTSLLDKSEWSDGEQMTLKVIDVSNAVDPLN